MAASRRRLVTSIGAMAAAQGYRRFPLVRGALPSSVGLVELTEAAT